jgi:preprotein translocase SecE subunit
MAQVTKQEDADRTSRGDDEDDDTTVTNVGDGPEKVAGPSGKDLEPKKPRGSSGGSGGGTPRVREDSGDGFFKIYKKGQGYWTRMGTAIGAGLLGLLLVGQIYTRVPAFMRGDAHRASKIAMIAAAVFGSLYAFLAWRLMNKPSNVDFLIATDSEMKKVNWTSRRELIGSTKVVIGFMFSIAICLFLLDLFFNTVFYYLHILHDPWWKTIFGTGGGQ